MKVKLLKKIRRNFEIFHWTNKNRYEITDNLSYNEERLLYLQRTQLIPYHKTMQGAKDEILRICKIVYEEHSKSYKIENEKTKVWYK